MLIWIKCEIKQGRCSERYVLHDANFSMISYWSGPKIFAGNPNKDQQKDLEFFSTIVYLFFLYLRQHLVLSVVYTLFSKNIWSSELSIISFDDKDEVDWTSIDDGEEVNTTSGDVDNEDEDESITKSRFKLYK